MASLSKHVFSKSDRLVTLVLTLTLAAYFPAAYWSRRVYVQLREPKGAVIHLQSFHRIGPPDTFGYSSLVQFVQKQADTPDSPQRSPYVIYEDDKPLGPAHSPRKDIEMIGRGRFLHRGDTFVFSTSDNSDPNVNGRNYWVVLPSK